MKTVYLSYNLDKNTPAYANGLSLHVAKDKDMQAGDSCNTQTWHLPNHLGTHIDAPRHFAGSGQTIESFQADFWICQRPALIELAEVKAKEIITNDHIQPFSVAWNIDLLLIKTGFGCWRFDESYALTNPGFAPELADYLRERFPNLKMIGFDVIALGSFANRELGSKAHKSFLDHQRPLLPIEDMKLDELKHGAKINKVILSPLRVVAADASPCTVFAEIEE